MVRILRCYFSICALSCSLTHICMKPATKHIHFNRGVNPVFSRNLGVILKLMVGADRSFPTLVLNMVEIAFGFWYVLGPGSALLCFSSSAALLKPCATSDALLICLSASLCVVSNILPNGVTHPALNFGPTYPVALSHRSRTSWFVKYAPGPGLSFP